MRKQKANRVAGIGDENGRMFRVKDPVKVSSCTICQKELTITKSNTELKNHASNKHDKTIEECFPGADALAAELIAKGKPAKGGSSGSGGPTITKKESKKNAASGMDDLFSAGLSKGKAKK